MVYKYIIITEIEGYSSHERCVEINNALFNITRPLKDKRNEDITGKVFQEVELLDGRWALKIAQSWKIKVADKHNIKHLITLFPDIPDAEKKALAQLIKDNKAKDFKFLEIIPLGTTLYTLDEIINLGLLEDTRIANDNPL